MLSLASSSSCERLDSLVESHGSWSDGGAGTVHRPRQPRAATAPQYYTVHCGGVRQAVRVIEMQTLRDEEELEAEHWPDVAQACRAAAGVLASSLSGCHPYGHSGGAATRMCLEFVHRRECLFAGMRLIVRERGSGRVAGGGCVVAVAP